MEFIQGTNRHQTYFATLGEQVGQTISLGLI